MYNVIYINIDGVVYSGTDRANAVKAWKMAAEDYRPFEVNITTNYDIYTNTPAPQRSNLYWTCD